MELTQLQDQLNKLHTDMHNLAHGSEKFDTEKRSQFDAMSADATSIESDITRIKALADFEKRAMPSIPRGIPGQALDATTEERSKDENSKEERSAFNRFLLGRMEQRDITTLTTGTNGGALVPQSFDGILHDAKKYYAPLSQIVGYKKTADGSPMKIALSNDVSNTFTLVGGEPATTITEVDPAFTSKLLSVDTVSVGLVKISVQELQDSSFDLENWLKTKMGMRYGRGLENVLNNGNGSNCQGLISAAHQTVTAIGANGANAAAGDGSDGIGYTDIAALYSSLDPAYLSNAKWQMNSATKGFLLGVKDGFGRPLFIPNPSSGAFDTLIGAPVVMNQSLPSIAAGNVGTVLFGDFVEGFMFREAGNLEIVRFNETFMNQLEIGFIGYARIGSTSLDAGTHPNRVACSGSKLINRPGESR